MGASRSFMDVLVGKLTAYVDVSSRPASAIQAPAWLTSLDPVTVSPQVSFRARQSAALPWFEAIAKPEPSAPQTTPSTARDVPVRSPAELTAIQLLRRLGATQIHAGSSDADLRTAWRVLLRACHPDAHPELREADRIILNARLRAVIHARDVLESRRVLQPRAA